MGKMLLHLGAVDRIEFTLELSRPKQHDVETSSWRSRHLRLQDWAELIAQSLTRPVQATLEGIHRDPERLSCFGRSERLDVAQHQYLAIVDWQCVERGLQELAHLSTADVMLGRRTIVGESNGFV